ncbi:MAG TPA: substrate-binding domain-containing protein [Anaerolineae bacterium]|nr:substrate-binding domain-containing protein [Anaerolineae bacterium]HQH37357.1 substrate-binding domain-containing protein [Anaerolineae bacterium]
MSNELSTKQRKSLIIGVVGIIVVCACAIVAAWAGKSAWSTLFETEGNGTPTGQNATTAELIVAVSPGMASTLTQLAEQFNANAYKTPDGSLMSVHTLTVVPEKMVEQSLANPPFQALAPDSSLWLNQLDRRWVAAHSSDEETSLIPIGNRRFGDPVRYATSPVVIAAWESVARELGWPDRVVGWRDIQQKATTDTTFKWNHPSTGHASGLLATLAEFYAGAGLTRGLTPEAATAQTTLDYVRAVEGTVRFYGEGEDVIVQRLAAEGRNFLDAFVAQEQVVIAWNQTQSGERLVALYPAEGTLWADHPLALLELGASDETPLTANQRRTYQTFVTFLTSPDVQRQLLAAGYRPANLDIRLDEAGSPFAGSTAADWRQPQTTLQIPAASVVEVVQNVWWYTKRPTNVYLVVDTSGSMEESDKIDLTRVALRSFVEQIRGDRDQVGLIAFASEVNTLRSLQPLDDAGRADLNRAIDQLRATGNTALIDGVWEAYTELTLRGNPEAINAIVVMTDGQENNSRHSFAELQQRLRQEHGTSVVIFTIAFGGDADEKLLRSMAEVGGGQFRRAQETDIEELYKIISTYF